MEDKRDLVSIIVPTRNGLQFLKPMMDSIELFTDWPFELIIVDNNSDDGTKEFILNSKYKMAGQYIRNEKNESFSKANNQGASIAKGKFLCLLNNDTLVTEGWLSAMMNVFSEEKAVGCVGARLVFPGRGLIQHAGVIQSSDGTPDHIYFNKPMDYPPAMERKDYFAVTGACLLTPKSLYEELGGLDESYFYGWEDVDYCNRIKENGLRIIYEPKAMVYHYESRTEGRYSSEGHNFNLYFSRWVLSK